MRAPARLIPYLLLPLLALPARGDDPVTTDPLPVEPPPSMTSIRIPSGDAVMNGIVYLPGGAGPHPVALVLHGLPGDERNLDLAQALRRGGWAVVFFHYRGAWGSGGRFAFDHVLEDVAAAVDWTLDDEVRAQHGFDAGARALVGHSMGGFAALTAGSADEHVGCIASLAGANMSLLGAAAADPAVAADLAASIDGWVTGPLAGTSGAALVGEVVEAGARYDVVARAPDLAARRVLLVAGERDVVAAPAQHHDPVLAALEAAGGDVEALRLDDDHAFSASRIALARALVSWLAEGCR